MYKMLFIDSHRESINTTAGNKRNCNQNTLTFIFYIYCNDLDYVSKVRVTFHSSENITTRGQCEFRRKLKVTKTPQRNIQLQPAGGFDINLDCTL